jgi:DNA-nicking Smr family endonuclease
MLHPINPITDRPIRIALVGCGRISANHIKAIAAHHDRAELIAICDTQPERLEPGRARRVVRERDPIAARIDLHGLTLDRARPALESFVTAAWSRGDRVVLVITGKGRDGEGLIRRLTPEWLAGPSLRAMIAGVQSAHRRHGGDGAFYVALKAQSNRQTG